MHSPLFIHFYTFMFSFQPIKDSSAPNEEHRCSEPFLEPTEAMTLQLWNFTSAPYLQSLESNICFLFEVLL